jgi:hypothetical protein
VEEMIRIRTGNIRCRSSPVRVDSLPDRFKVARYKAADRRLSTLKAKVIRISMGLGERRKFRLFLKDASRG